MVDGPDADDSAGPDADDSVGPDADDSAGPDADDSVGPDADDSVGPGQRVRRYRPEDRAAVVALHHRALSEAGTDPADVPGTQDLRWVEEAYLATGGEFLVVDTPRGDGAGPDDADAGVVAMGGLLVDGEEGELFRFAVDPDHQREGYGSAVLDALEAAARDRGVERLELTTASRQAAAVAFYRSRGFRETGREHYGEYELVRFAKRL